MMRTLLASTLYNKRWFILGWSAAMFGTILLVMLFFPSFKQSGGFDQLAAHLPSQLQNLIGDPDSFHTIKGYIATQLYDIRVPLMLMIMGLVLAQNLAASDEEKGSLRTLLTTPLSRTRVLWERWGAGAIIIAIVVIAIALAAIIGTLAVGEQAPLGMIVQLAVLSWFFTTTAFTITYAVGCATGRRGIMMTVGLLVTFGSFVISSFVKSVDWLDSVKYISLLNYYDTGAIKDGSFNTADLWILTILSLIFMLIAIVGFRRRDVS